MPQRRTGVLSALAAALLLCALAGPAAAQPAGLDRIERDARANNLFNAFAFGSL
jgi:hypothetical protein